MSKVNLYHIEQLKAIDGFLSNKPDFSYRKICRWFSKTFSTPLREVLNMPMPVILQHYYESQVEDADFNHIYELAKAEYLPEFIKQAEDDDQAFADSLIEEQKETLRKKAMRDNKAKKSKEVLPNVVRSDIKKENRPNKGLDERKGAGHQSLNKQPDSGAEVPEIDMDFDYGDPDGTDE